MKTDKITTKVHAIVSDFLTQLGLDPEIEVSLQTEEEVNYILVKLIGENLAELIGFHGRVFESVQNILGLIISKDEKLSEYRLLLEINDYRVQREEYLKEYARRAADEVKMNKSSLEMPPMKSFERRIIHIALKTDTDVFTESIGEGYDRRIIIKYKDLT